MIQTKTAVVYGSRSEKQGVIMIEVRPTSTEADRENFLVIDWDIADMDNAWFSKPYYYMNDQVNSVNDYLDTTYPQIAWLSKTDQEYIKIVLALMLNTQTNLLDNGKTIYGMAPADWEFSPEVLVRFPFLASV